MKKTVLRKGSLLFTICAVMVVGIMTGCYGDFRPKKGDGNIVSQERTASGFSGITVDWVANVNVYIGEDYKVVVTTDDNLQAIVLTEVENNILYITEESKMNSKPTKLIVDVYLPELKSIDLRGVGNVNLSNGNASDLEISLSGVGNIDAQNYQIQHVTINHSGVGNAKIWVTDSLKGSLSGVGKISYKGNPTIAVNVSGVGKVNKL